MRPSEEKRSGRILLAFILYDFITSFCIWDICSSYIFRCCFIIITSTTQMAERIMPPIIAPLNACRGPAA